MTECPFCRRDPFHYVDNGVGMEAVAVTCCDLGDLLFRGKRDVPDEVTISWDEFVEIANRLRAHDSVSFEAGERSMRDAAVKIAAQYVAYNPNTKFAVIKTHIAQRILDKLRKLPIKIKVTEIVE